VKLLFEHGLDVTSIESWEAAFCLAVKEGHLEIVKLLLEHGADVNIIMHFRWPGGRPDGPGGSTSPTALEIAKQNGHMKVFGFISQWLEQKLNLDPFCTKTSSS
jgi:ankyrin repeat protein